jgi:photosystem II stability/assembly factor-like uncharacterized protein
MNEAAPAGGRARARRSLALIALAGLVLIGAAVLYLRPSLVKSSAPPRRAGPATAARPFLASMTWQSAKLGWITTADSVGTGHSWLFRTADGGQHWRQLRTETGGIMQVRFFNAQEGQLSIFAEGDGLQLQPHVLLTADGGSSWRPVSLPAAVSSNQLPMEFLDPKHGWFVIGHSPGSIAAQLYLTQDGGRHWEGPREIPGDGAVWFADPQHGWLGGHNLGASAVLFTTRDAGQHWTQLSLPAPPGGWPPDAFNYVASPTVLPTGLGTLLVYEEPAQAMPPPGRRKWVYLTRDGGDTWSGPISKPGGPSMLSFGPYLRDEAGWLTSGPSAWFSSDLGGPWTAAGSLPPDWQFGIIAPVAQGTAWAQGVQGSTPDVNGTLTPSWGLFRTTDRGRHWSRVQVPPAISQH